MTLSVPDLINENTSTLEGLCIITFLHIEIYDRNNQSDNQQR